jgi:thioesterase domain-containing protein
VNLTVAGAETAPVTPQLAREAAARLFRSVRAGRMWLRARGGETRETGACVPMKPGAEHVPSVFMIPGAPGSILQLGPVAAAMTGDSAVYAIRPRGIEEGEIPCETLAEMAEYAIAQMKALRPQGPYPLVGYSAGGLVAIEMAQRLAATGDDVPLLVLLDTYPSRAIWPVRCHAEILGRQAFRALGALLGAGPKSLLREIARRLRSLSDYLSASGVSVLPPPPLVAEGVSAASRRVHLASYNAGEAYRPVPYAGKVLFIQPEEVPDLEPRRPGLVWNRLLRDFEVCCVPGTHLGLVDAGAAATAAAICDRLAHLNIAGGSQP